LKLRPPSPDLIRYRLITSASVEKILTNEPVRHGIWRVSAFAVMRTVSNKKKTCTSPSVKGEFEVPACPPLGSRATSTHAARRGRRGATKNSALAWLRAAMRRWAGESSGRHVILRPEKRRRGYSFNGQRAAAVTRKTGDDPPPKFPARPPWFRTYGIGAQQFPQGSGTETRHARLERGPCQLQVLAGPFDLRITEYVDCGRMKRPEPFYTAGRATPARLAGVRLLTSCKGTLCGPRTLPSVPNEHPTLTGRSEENAIRGDLPS